MTVRLLNPGGMTRRVTITQPTVTKDSSGAPQSAWPTFAIIWAKREDLPGREIWQARQVTAVVPVRYRIWYLDGLTTKMRLVDGSQVFDIKSVGDPDGFRRELILLCEETV